MKIYNKGVRIFHYGDKPTDFIAPATFKEIDDKTAKPLLESYSRELVLADDYRKYVKNNASEIAKKDVEIAKQKAETEKRENELKELRKQLAAMQKLIADK